MKARCTNPKAHAYEKYGGRGITVHPPWIDSFEAFLADMGIRPAGTTLDRIDNDGNYDKNNCRWATKLEQDNNRKSNVFVEFQGERMTQAEAARRSGVSRSCISKRIRRGFPPEDIFVPDYQLIPLSRLNRCADRPNSVSYLGSMPEESNGSKSHKRVTSAISWDATTGYLNIQWGDGQSTSYNLGELDQSIQNALMYFGALARVQQSYTTCAGNPVVAREKAAKLWTQLRAGNWGLRTGEKAHSVTIQALALLLKIPEPDAAARFYSLPVDKRREVSSRSDVVAQVAKLKAKANPLQSLDSILK
jgi:hypothetical protein